MIFCHASHLTKWFIRIFITLSISIAVFFTSYSYSKCDNKPVTVGVIDTGFGYQEHGKEASLCKLGHRNFTHQPEVFKDNRTSTPIPLDLHGHGTNIAGIIDRLAKSTKANFCIVVLKYYVNDGYGSQNLKATVDAINWAADIKLDYLNYSSGGEDPSADEFKAIERYLNGGGTLVVAAGNNGMNLDDKDHHYYPACYTDKRIIVVGMLDKNGVQYRYSNYGSVVTRWEIGAEVDGFGISESGTSQAAAVATGKLVAQTKSRCKDVPIRRKSSKEKETR